MKNGVMNLLLPHFSAFYCHLCCKVIQTHYVYNGKLHASPSSSTLLAWNWPLGSTDIKEMASTKNGAFFPQSASC